MKKIKDLLKKNKGAEDSFIEENPGKGKHRGKRLRKNIRLISVGTTAVFFIVIILLFNVFAWRYITNQAETCISETNNYYLALDNVISELNDNTLSKEKRQSLEKEMEIIQKEYQKKNLPVTVSIIGLNSTKYLEEFATDDEKNLIKAYNKAKRDDSYNFSSTEELEVGDHRYFVSRSNFLLNEGDAEPSDVLLYTDELSAYNMVRALDRIFIVVALISGISALLVGFNSARRINKGLDSLKTQIIRTVNASSEDDLKLNSTGYREFDDLANIVNEMAQKVSQSQTIQKQVFQNASHELRTPLMSIQGYAEGIQAGVLKNHKDAAGIIIDESRKMSELVDDMLFVSRMDEATVQMRVDIMDLRQIIEDCREEVSMAAMKKGVMLVEEIDDGNYETRGDEKQLAKAFSNVLSNAVRYAKTKVTLSVTVGEQFAVVISDDGPGISDETLPHIFERFYKGEGGNFGIGLSITKDVVDNHGGTVFAENAEEGTRFTILLPKSSDKQVLASSGVDETAGL